MSPIQSNIANFVTYMTKNDAMAPIIALESTVTGGRTIQAYKRGGEDEARERLIEETTGAVVWLCGVKVLNSIGDKILGKMFGGNFDVGTDKVLRTPFKNFMKKHPPKGFSEKQVAIIKAVKVLASVVFADAFIGLVVPPLNQSLTKHIAERKAEKEDANSYSDKLELSSKEKDKKSSSNTTFKGGAGLAAINTFTNAIEKTNTGKLLSTDAGLISGRMYSARNSDERREISIRDIGSIYFYMWAQSHVGNLMNYLETGRFTRLNPSTANILDEQLKLLLKSGNGEMTVEDFKNKVLGKNLSEIQVSSEVKFECGELSKFDKFMNKFRKNKLEPLQVAKVCDLRNIYTDNEIFSRIEAMSKLQPLREGEAVITKQQIIDALNVCEINNPKFLDNVFSKFTNNASKDEFRFVSNKQLYDLKAQMENYVKDLCKLSKDGKINEGILNKMKNKNLAYNGINFVAGFAVAAAFLSTLIPKFQYWVTRQKTGRNEFPGTYGLAEQAKEYVAEHHHHQVEVN